MPVQHIDETSTVIEATRLVRLSYLQTIAALDDQALLGQLAGVSSGGQESSFTSSPPTPGFFFGLFGGSDGLSINSDFSDSGWAISRTWLETWWDKIRWGIALRELGIYSYEYAEASEIVSIPFRSPKEITKVTLRVDDQIPTSYPNSKRWIHYFISVNNGNDWHRINPLDHPTLFSGEGGQPVPRIINVNADFQSEDDNEAKFIKTKEPTREVRFRAVLLRPSGEEFVGSTPILKSYRILIVPKEGLLDD